MTYEEKKLKLHVHIKNCVCFFPASISLPYDLTACIGVTHEKKIYCKFLQ